MRGERPLPALRRDADSVHPRVRGERQWVVVHRASCIGSSPRARGTPSRRDGVPRPRRFIPACAGNARWQASQRPQPPVHPRVRGERSSFRARESGRQRFIPACAGNAGAEQPTCRFAPVHPRVRGERFNTTAVSTSANGSSPRARGTLTHQLVHRFHEVGMLCQVSLMAPHVVG